MPLDYIGSKAKLFDFIFRPIARFMKKGIEGQKLLDICAGSGRVSREAAEMGFDVVSIDILHLSACIVNGSVGISSETVQGASEHLAKINASDGISGFFHRNYSPAGGRMYFTEANAKRIDFARKYITEKTSGEMQKYLLYCSLLALSRVQNTSGHQTSYLKRFKERALKPFLVRAESVVAGKATTITGDVFEILRTGRMPKAPVAYIDPPYNNRQYGHNYHLYETFVRNDNPAIHGKTGIRDWASDTKSEFCLKHRCLDFMKDIVSMIPARKVFMSYSSDGIATREEIEDGLESLACCKRIVTHVRAQKRFKHSSRVSNTSKLYEYLFEVTKT